MARSEPLPEVYAAVKRALGPDGILFRVTTAWAEAEWWERSLSLAVDGNPKPSDCGAINLPPPVLLS